MHLQTAHIQDVSFKVHRAIAECAFQHAYAQDDGTRWLLESTELLQDVPFQTAQSDWKRLLFNCTESLQEVAFKLHRVIAEGGF